MPCDILTVNDTKYTVLRLLGKGKGGYSYLVTDGRAQYVLKQIHHEPCDYYTFGDKLQSELRDYKTLRTLGIPMPELLAADVQQERILKRNGVEKLEMFQSRWIPLEERYFSSFGIQEKCEIQLNCR